MFLLPTLKEGPKGVYMHKAKRSTDADIGIDYKKRAITYLRNDVQHYARLKIAFPELFAKEFWSVADIGGGHPKFAATMNIAGKVTVYDYFAPTYEDTHSTFLELYPCDNKIEYKKTQITHSQFSPDAELAICSHVFEHLKPTAIRRILTNLDTDKVLVYGPNIVKANGVDWIHYTDAPDHCTFAIREVMERWVKAAGFEIKISEDFSDDYLIYGDR